MSCQGSRYPACGVCCLSDTPVCQKLRVASNVLRVQKYGHINWTHLYNKYGLKTFKSPRNIIKNCRCACGPGSCPNHTHSFSPHSPIYTWLSFKNEKWKSPKTTIKSGKILNTVKMHVFTRVLRNNISYHTDISIYDNTIQNRNPFQSFVYFYTQFIFAQWSIENT